MWSFAFQRFQLEAAVGVTARCTKSMLEIRYTRRKGTVMLFLFLFIYLFIYFQQSVPVGRSGNDN